MSTDYWSKLLSRQALSRRRALALAGTGAAGAMLLAACGSDSGSDGDDDGATAPNTKVGEYTPSSGTAQPGGKFVVQSTTVANYHPISEWSEGTTMGGVWVYDRP